MRSSAATRSRAAAEHMLELIGVVGLAAFAALNPRDDLLRRVGIGKPGEEARAVQIRIGRDLEARLHPARGESERVVERGVVADHRPEHHFVVAPLGAPDSSVHPRFHEHRAAFRPPARDRVARRRQVRVEQCFRVGGLDPHLSAEELAPAAVFGGRHVALHGVNQLVIHQRVEALARRKGLEGVRDRRDVDDHPIVRQRIGDRRPDNRTGP